MKFWSRRNERTDLIFMENSGFCWTRTLLFGIGIHAAASARLCRSGRNSSPSPGLSLRLTMPFFALGNSVTKFVDMMLGNSPGRMDSSGVISNSDSRKKAARVAPGGLASHSATDWISRRAPFSGHSAQR